MILHFIFVIKEQDVTRRQSEFQYIKEMAKFFQSWIKEKFDIHYTIQCDQLATKPRSILDRLDTSTMIRDHEQRGKDIYHFYLTHFRPLWTDCACEGYHAENFGMAYWVEPKDQSDTLHMAEKNCTTVSHELLHEILRTKKHKGYVKDVHDTWTKHLFEQLEFEQYDESFQKTDQKPTFLAMDTSTLFD
ncbi:MAG: hypothetical protein D9C04_00455 [Nitrosopumilus sp. B06]|nr:MAG: hypothetical protein D9C04_00455 [Nitrosopumilus sp. B06]